jgi:hypothetical protein
MKQTMKEKWKNEHISIHLYKYITCKTEKDSKIINIGSQIQTCQKLRFHSHNCTSNQSAVHMHGVKL